MAVTEKTRAKIEAVQKRMKEKGENASQACLALGITKSSYFSALQNFKSKPKLRKNWARRSLPIIVSDIPQTHTSKLVAIVGSPKEVSDFLRSYQ